MTLSLKSNLQLLNRLLFHPKTRGRFSRDKWLDVQGHSVGQWTGGFGLGPGRPLALPEPEPTRPFDLSLSEPTYLHQPNLYLHFRSF